MSSQPVIHPTVNRSTARLPSVDALRGGIMILMALDHTRDFIHAGAMAFSPEDLTRTTPILFLTRWITHICAPTFMLLAGAGAFLRRDREKSPRLLSRFLWTRGLWLIVIELTIMRLGMNFSLGPPNPLLLIVLTALGLSMIVLAALIHLPKSRLFALSVAVIVLHNLLDPIQASRFGAWAWMWNLLHQPGVFMVGALPVVVSYPLIPWFAVMALGFSCGPVLLMDTVRRRRVLFTTGALLTIAFVLVRAANTYGDPSPWSAQTSRLFTILSFLRTTKYPPSFQFLLMTIGPASIALALLDRVPARAGSVLAIVGRVPFFFYVVHFWILHVVEAVLAFVRYGRASLTFLFHPLPSMGGPRELFPQNFGHPLWVVYVVWIGVVVGLYPICRWFAQLKQRQRDWWVSYL
jgi:uncharacterized membrane protein